MDFEISESKVLIEKLIKKKVSHFCIPYGFYNKELFQSVENAGYKSVVTEKMGYYSPSQKSFKVLPRFTVKAKINQNDFIKIVCQQRSKMVPQYLTESALHGAKKILGFKGYMRLKSLIVQSSK